MNPSAISGDSTLLKTFTQRINRSYDKIMPFLLSLKGETLSFDDSNHTDFPIGVSNLTSGVNDYSFLVDENSNSILNITKVLFLPSSSATEYVELTRMQLNDELATFALSPNPSNVGVPTHFMENNNTILLYPKPNYTAVNGLKILFERQPSYFVSTDTTKTPGIPLIFHELLAKYASLDWLLVNKPDNSTLVTRLEDMIRKDEANLKTVNQAKNPTTRRMTAGHQNNR